MMYPGGHPMYAPQVCEREEERHTNYKRSAVMWCGGVPSVCCICGERYCCICGERYCVCLCNTGAKNLSLLWRSAYTGVHVCIHTHAYTFLQWHARLHVLPRNDRSPHAPPPLSISPSNDFPLHIVCQRHVPALGLYA